VAKFDLEFEEEILAAALKSDDFIRRASRVASQHHFATKHHSWIWKVVSEEWMKFRERPTAKIYIAQAKREFPDAADREPYLVLLKKLFKTKPKAPRLALKELGQFVLFVEYQKATEEIVDALEKNELTKAEEVLNRASRLNARERTYTHIQWVEDFEDRQARRKHEKEHPEEFVVIPTGFKTLDRVMTGGVRIGELGLIMGTTGRGKSVILTNMAHAAVARGFKCCYFAFEMPARQIATRHDSRWSQLTYNAFKSFDFKPSELRRLKKKHAKAMRQYANKYHIVSWPIRGADINSVYGALEDLRTEFEFEPDLLIFDSGDHLRAIESKRESFRLQQSEVYWSLKALAEDNGFAVLSSVHAGREWAKRTATAEAASEAYDKSRIADMVASVNDPNANRSGRKAIVEEDDEEDDDGEEISGPGESKSKVSQLEIHLAKYRDGESKMSFPVRADFARMTIKEPKEEDEDE